MAEAEVAITKTCPNCGKTETVMLEYDKFHRWQEGDHVHNVWPEKTPDQREQLITGICSDRCWNEYLGMKAE